MKISPSLVLALVVINATIFVFSQFIYPQLMQYFALYFFHNPHFFWWQFFSYLFLHGDILHLIFNMYALLAFGGQLEKIWGTRRFLIYYLTCGIGAALIFTLANYYQFNDIYQTLASFGVTPQEIQQILSDGAYPRNLLQLVSEADMNELFSVYYSPAVGASGAIYGVLIAFAFTYPRAKLALIFLPFPISAQYFVPLIILSDLFFGFTSYSIGNIAHFAHVGGAICGVLLMLIWRPLRQQP